MKVTRDVIVDLWPSYETGLASADTRALVEEFLAGDPDLREKLRESDEALERLLQPSRPAAPPDVEKVAFDRMRELTRLRTYFFVLSVLMVVSAGMLRQFRLFSTLMGAGAAFVCAGLWLAESRPGLAALAIGPLVETRAQAGLRTARGACILASFLLLALSGLTRIGDDTVLLGLSAASLAGWLALALAGRRPR